MMNFIEAHNLTGLVIGALTFITIGVFHPIVVKAEYYTGVKLWWLFLIAGLTSIVGSLFVSNLIVSVLLGVLGFTLLWSIGELFEQRQRVKKGWFPENPKRKIIENSK